ncbi:MAG: PEP-CTERM sorting domain-containing protein [Gemmatimonadetes bacterium]|nr:PEP-CTERM sorting domain-containing protein [Gemmatimonadota bacterium]
MLPVGLPGSDANPSQVDIDGGLAPVPEPATMGLMAIGLVAMPGMGWVRRRQQQA